MRTKNYPDLSLNPNNVKIGDTVVINKDNSIGLVQDVVGNNGNGKILQFWVKIADSTAVVPNPYLASSLTPIIEKSGSYREAVLYSVSVNSNHGLRRTNADKRKAVLTLLGDSEWNQWSNREIARQCSVSKHLVNTLRLENENLTGINSTDFTESPNVIQRKYITKQGSESIMNTTNIGGEPKQRRDSSPKQSHHED